MIKIGVVLISIYSLIKGEYFLFLPGKLVGKQARICALIVLSYLPVAIFVGVPLGLFLDISNSQIGTDQLNCILSLFEFGVLIITVYLATRYGRGELAKLPQENPGENNVFNSEQERDEYLEKFSQFVGDQEK